VNYYRMLEEGEQGAAIGAFLLAHEGHTQEVEIQRGPWTVYCRCALRRGTHLRGGQRREEAGARAVARTAARAAAAGGRRRLGPGEPSRRPVHVGGVGVVDLLLGSAILLSLA
jgi:hypothetical protein